MLLTESGDLSDNLLLSDSVLQSIDTYTMSRRDASEFIDWFDYDSPLSPMDDIDHTLDFFDHPQPRNHPQYDQHPRQPFFGSNSFMEESPQYEDLLELHEQTGYSPTYYPMQHYAYVPSSVMYQVPVGFVDESAIIFGSDHDQTSQYDDLFPVGFVDEYATTFGPDHDQTSQYEDWLELQDQIGSVNVGLSVETISKNLKTSCIPADSHLKDQEGEVCAVCQDEYKVNDTIGSLECGHRFHENCIKQWLLQKNVCPICKATALVL